MAISADSTAASRSLYCATAALVETPMIAVNTTAAGASGVSTKPPPATMPSITPAMRICADGEPLGNIVHGSVAHRLASTPACSMLLRTTFGLTRVGILRRWRSQPTSPSAHIAHSSPHHDQRNQGATATGNVSASSTALTMLTPISHGETNVTHCTSRARISADSVSRPR